jgi:hypothetical protein
MRRILAIVALVAALPLGAALPAAAKAPSVCADAYVELNGEVVVDDSLCLPDGLPTTGRALR